MFKRPQLSKTGSASVRATLYMAAVVATKYNPHIKHSMSDYSLKVSVKC
ncbi:MAG: transposase [Agitococcus sp.]|nr:transposase [Agitococcus sp.]